MVTVSDITLCYGPKTALRDVSFSLKPGVTALLGSNGAGKSSLVKVLTTTETPRSGNVHFRGKLVHGVGRRSVSRKSYLRLLGVLPQHLSFPPHFTVIEFLTYSGWLRGLSAKEARLAAPEALDRVGLADRATSRMKNLSGGMIRRAGIAAAILGDPEVAIFDEPTAGLDVEQRAAFRSTLHDLPTGTASLLCTHIASDVTDTCQEAIVLSAGSVVYAGSIDGLKQLAPSGTPEHLVVEQGYLAAIQHGKVTK